MLDIVFLGTGSPLPSPVRCGAGQVIISGGQTILVDCGWGVARRLNAARIPPPTIDVAVFTHMHSDHITDVPDFLISRWTGGARRPLTVYGPEGTRETMEGFLAALRRDIGYRFAHHGDKLSREGIRVEVIEVPATAEPHAAGRAGDLLMESFEVDHKPVVPALGWRFTAGGVRAVLSGDTTACETLLRASEGADLLVCEAMNVEMLAQRAAALRAFGNTHVAGMLDDVPDYHAPTLDVARLARDAGVRQLILSHVIPPIAEDGPEVATFVAGMAALYNGPLSVARDLQRVQVLPHAAAS